MTPRNSLSWTSRMACLAAALALWTPAPLIAAQVRGTVVDRDGKPAAGAKVWAAKLGIGEPQETREAIADGSGAFAVEAGPGNWLVFAVRGEEGGRTRYQSIAEVGDGKAPEPVTIRLGAASKFRGRLLDAETGKPIPAGRFALDDARRVEVDAQGRFEAPGLEMGNHEAYPLCPGYQRKRILFDTTGRADAELELKLLPAGKVVGRVVDEAGKPIPGASVGLNTSGTILSGSALWERCSEDGRYTYDGLTIGNTRRLTASAPGYQDQERQDVVALDASNPTVYDFTLRPDPLPGPRAKVAAPTLNRRVVSGSIAGPDGKPVADAVVRWDLRVSSDGVPETKSDTKGEFRLEGVPDAANVLSVMAKGLAPAFPVVDAGGDRQVKVDLKAGLTIRGRVVDDAGTPIERAWISPRISNPKPNWMGFVYLDTLRADTDRDGRFTLEGMPEGVRCDVVAENHSAIRDRVLSATDESKNEMTLLGEGAIRGRVVGPFGDPIRNFRVQVGIPRDAKPGEPVGGFFAGFGGTGVAFTRDDGEFTISRLTAGNLHRLTVIADGLGSGEADRVEARPIARLKPAEELTIKLGAGHPLRVRVYQKDGKRVEAARVTVIQNEGRGGFQWGYSENSWDDSVTTRVDDKGWAEFPSLAFGKGTVVVRAKGFARQKIDWVKDEEEFNVYMEPESRLEGTVLDEEGKPVAGTRIVLSWGQGQSMNVTVDEKDGGFQAGELGSGKYTLSVLPEIGQALSNGAVELEPGKTTTEEVRVQRPAPKVPAKAKK